MRHNTFSYFTLLMQGHHAFEFYVTTIFDILLFLFERVTLFYLHLFTLFSVVFISRSAETKKDDNKLERDLARNMWHHC